ncbi:butyrophilin-like protein 8 isoform 1-T2 [Discoglossus pictus]
MGIWMSYFMIAISFGICSVVCSLTDDIYNVYGPKHPIEATIGSDVLLPCYLSPQSSALDMEVQWLKHGLPLLIHHFMNGKDQPAKQHPQYEGRTTVFYDSISNGNVSLLLRNVQTTDEGLYICGVFHGLEKYAEIELEVNALGVQPWISITLFPNDSLLVKCSSSGWYPQPKISWTGTNDHHFTNSVMVMEEADGLLGIHSSLWIDSIKTGILECKITSAHTEKNKISSFQITESIFPDRIQNKKLIVGLKVGLASTIIVLLITVFSACYYFWKEKEKIKYLEASVEMTEMQKYAVRLTLDPDTAHCNLKISEDLLSVVHTDEQRDVPILEKRFNSWCAVLASQEFSTGKAYWEVFVGSKSNWDIGVTYNNSNRSGWIYMGPKYGYWGLRLIDSKNLKAMMNPIICLKTPFPRKVGVFLDYEGNRLSFYNVEKKTCIFTCEAQFKNSLRPYFSPGHNRRQTNGDPLQINTHQSYSDIMLI